MTLSLAFLVFGKKRRDEAPTGSDADLAAAAASPYTAFGNGLAPAFAGISIDISRDATCVSLEKCRPSN